MKPSAVKPGMWHTGAAAAHASLSPLAAAGHPRTRLHGGHQGAARAPAAPDQPRSSCTARALRPPAAARWCPCASSMQTRCTPTLARGWSPTLCPMVAAAKHIGMSCVPLCPRRCTAACTYHFPTPLTLPCPVPSPLLLLLQRPHNYSAATAWVRPARSQPARHPTRPPAACRT